MPKEFQFVRLLGEGSSSRVHLCRARDVASPGKPDALRVLKVLRTKKPDVDDLREICLLRVASKHPCIVKYFGAFTLKDRMCICLEYASGGDLGQVLRVRRREGVAVTPEEASSWIAQLSLGLHALHEMRIIHRDIKPANAFLLGDGRVVLGDLGAALAVSTATEFHTNAERTNVGTPSFMAPEVALAQAYGPASDVYSLGLTAFEICSSGLKPFLKMSSPSSSLLAIRAEGLQWSRLSKSMHEFRGLLTGMLELEPHQRPTMSQVLHDPCVVRGTCRLLRDCASGRVCIKVSLMEMLLDQVCDLGLEASALLALKTGLQKRTDFKRKRASFARMREGEELAQRSRSAAKYSSNVGSNGENRKVYTY